MTHEPLVTVIIPSFNHADYIDQAIASVRAQTYDNWELIVVDDGSSDDTPEILQKFESQPRIAVIRNPVNRGQSAVLNQALAASTGEFVCFLPSDDWYLPDKLRLLVARFQELDSSYGVVYGRGQRYFEDTGITVDIDPPVHCGWVLRHLVERNFVYPITPMFRRECFDRYPFDERYKAEGEAIFLKLALTYRFAFVPDVVGVMRDHSRNAGKDIDMMLQDNLRYWEEFFARSDLPREIRGLKNWRISRLLRLKGLELVVSRGRMREGRDALVRCIRMFPRNLLDVRVIAALSLTMIPSRLARKLVAARGVAK